MNKYVIGIDEVGRGPLAGPMVIVAALIPRKIRFKKSLGPLRDSKRMTAVRRKEWAEYLKNHSRVRYALTWVEPTTLDVMNVSSAANVAALRVMRSIILQSGMRVKPAVYLDGSLFLGNGSRRQKGNTIIRGDQKINAIKAASIIAKVYRDQRMIRLAKRYPGYGFEIHKGYGTKAHRQALQDNGPSPIHRLTFIGKKAKIKA